MDLKAILEAALFAAQQPVSWDRLQGLFADEAEPPTADALRQALRELAEDYRQRPLELVQVASGWRFQVRSEYSPWVSKLFEEKPGRYSRAVLETLAIIAYRQPTTRGEIEQIRGVAVSQSVIRTLLDREWVHVVGHKEVPGRPGLYATTKQFLDYFNLQSLDQLPTLKALADLDGVALDSLAPVSGSDESTSPADGEPTAAASTETDETSQTPSPESLAPQSPPSGD